MTNPKPVYRAIVDFSQVRDCPYWGEHDCNHPEFPAKKCYKTEISPPPDDCPCLCVADPTK